MVETTDATTDPWRFGRPSWVPSIEEYRTPGQEWSAFLSQQQPFWSTRAPMRDVGENLMARYMLSAPYMAEQGVSPTFTQYIGDYPQTTRGAEATYPTYGFQYGADPGQGLAELRRRAEEAAQAAVEAPGPYLAGIPQGELGTQQRAEWNRRAWLAAQFGEAAGAQAAAENQRAVANLLALRRPEEQGGGMYRGRMADAIRGAMARMQQHRINTGAPSESFLDWYLTQTGSKPRVLSSSLPDTRAQATAAGATAAGGQAATPVATTSVTTPVTTPVATTTVGTTPDTSDSTKTYRDFASETALGEYVADRYRKGLPQIATVDPRSATYRDALDLMPEPYDDIEAEKRDAGLPYNTRTDDGRRGTIHIPTTRDVVERVRERDREKNRLLEEADAKHRMEMWNLAMAASGGRTGVQADVTQEEKDAFVPRGAYTPPGKGGPVDQYGYTLPPGQQLSERDKERNRRIKEYMDQGIPYSKALRLANEGL